MAATREFFVTARRVDASRGVAFEIVVDTDEPDRQLELLHENVRRYGTVFNTRAPRERNQTAC